MVEFAIIVPMLLLALSGIIEFGSALYTWQANKPPILLSITPTQTAS